MVVNILLPGDINPSGESIKDLLYEWADKDYKWNVDRDLKAREPLFGSGQYYKVKQNTTALDSNMSTTFFPSPGI